MSNRATGRRGRARSSGGSRNPGPWPGPRRRQGFDSARRVACLRSPLHPRDRSVRWEGCHGLSTCRPTDLSLPSPARVRREPPALPKHGDADHTPPEGPLARVTFPDSLVTRTAQAAATARHQPLSVNHMSPVAGWKSMPRVLRIPCATGRSVAPGLAELSSEIDPRSGCRLVSLQSRISPLPGTLHGEPMATYSLSVSGLAAM